MKEQKTKPYVVYKGKKYVRGFGMVLYTKATKKAADKFYAK